MNSLFAPWRMEFVEGHQERSGCVLCNIGMQQPSKDCLMIHRGNRAYVVMNKYPYANGHIMVVPQRHLADWTELSADELSEMANLTQKSLKVLGGELKAQGFNIGVNLGRAAGAGIADHVHQHIVPRWVGDYNFMPLLSETKVISEHLEATYKRLVGAWT